ncbi:MAG: two-component regulator propeller domain-containing protein [Bacteroidia bacterium]|nr:two-component regulator propeller domain-containing protein [Bacteroidia bacterium]
MQQFGWALALCMFVFLGRGPVAVGQETQALGQWRGYFGHGECRGVLISGSQYFHLSAAGFVVYDAADGTYAEYGTTEGLSGIDPTAIGSDPSSGTVLVGYADGRIDFFTALDNIRLVTDISRNTTITNKAIRDFEAAGGLVYTATDFGLVGYDLAERATRFSVRRISPLGPDRPVWAVEVLFERVWVLLDDGLYSAPLTANLSQPDVWRLETGQNGLPTGTLRWLAATDTVLWVSVGTTLYRGTADGFVATGLFINGAEEVAAAGERLWVTFFDFWFVYDQAPSLVASQPIVLAKRAAVAADDSWVVSGDDSGLRVGSLSGATFSQTFARLPNLPFNGARGVAAVGGRVYVAPTGPTASFVPDFNQRAGVWLVDPRANAYTVLSTTRATLGDSVRFNFGGVAHDPTTGDVWFGSWSDGLVQTNGRVPVRSYTIESSPVSGIVFNSTTGLCEVSYHQGLVFDPRGNLYVACFNCCRPLQVRTPADTWVNLPLNRSTRLLTVKYSPTTGFLYLLNDPGNPGAGGLIVYDPGSDPEVTTNDRQRSFTTGTGNGNLPAAGVTSVAEDRDGALWVGTTNGVGVIFSPGAAFSGGTAADAVTPLLDGFPLLRDLSVTAIAVDGANNKWLGTDGEGVYYVSAAGDAVLARFTTDNSPLPSNTIRDIAIDDSTGEVLFATPGGLVSYRSAVTEPRADNETLVVFPNPVYSDFTGTIAIQGVAEGSVVRLTDVAGRLVRELRAQGGGIVWDGRDRQGQLVQSGVYLAWLARTDGSAGGVAKIAYIRTNGNP